MVNAKTNTTTEESIKTAVDHVFGPDESIDVIDISTERGYVELAFEGTAKLGIENTKRLLQRGWAVVAVLPADEATYVEGDMCVWLRKVTVTTRLGVETE